MFRILMFFVSQGSIGKKNTVCLLLESLPPGINPFVDDRLKIKSTSYVVNMLE